MSKMELSGKDLKQLCKYICRHEEKHEHYEKNKGWKTGVLKAKNIIANMKCTELV